MDLKRADLDDLLAAHALDALDDDDRAALDGALADDPTLAAAAAPLREVAGWLGAGEAAEPPAGLRARVLGAALARRPAGSTPTVPETPPLAFAQQVAELRSLAGDLPAGRW